MKEVTMTDEEYELFIDAKRKKEQIEQMKKNGQLFFINEKIKNYISDSPCSSCPNNKPGNVCFCTLGAKTLSW